MTPVQSLIALLTPPVTTSGTVVKVISSQQVLVSTKQGVVSCHVNGIFAVLPGNRVSLTNKTISAVLVDEDQIPQFIV